MEQAEQVHFWTLGADLAVLGTEQRLRVDGSPVLCQGALLVAMQPSGSTSTGSRYN